MPTPCKANEEWVRKFYANLKRTNFDNPQLTIRGKIVMFVTEQINDILGLPDHPLEPVREKDNCNNREWIISKLYPAGMRGKWANKRKGLKSIDFIAKAKIWPYIICNRVSPCGNVSNVSYTIALIIACILDDIHVNVGHYILQELKKYLLDDSSCLMFPSLIIELCRRADVEVRSTDHWLPADKPFHPLRVTGEGSTVKSKKRKATNVAGPKSSSQAALPEGPFGMLNSQLGVIRDLVSQLPSRPSHPHPRPEYFTREEMKTYLENQPSRVS
nr:uncharacterized protein LOC117281468 [Nicotiana tomentosiformis]XP_033517222.1 uncharacterized protein LOC117281468 [Nicotiana tomentosiformis]